MQNNITLSILITTMNDGIYRVKKELIPQLKNIDEVIVSHQITDKNIKPETKSLGNNVKYVFMREKWLSKNRNNALKYATADICHICDDDLNFLAWFEKTIKNTYQKTWAEIITFQAENDQWKKHFPIKEWKHNIFSILRLWSWWITFDRKKILEKGISFDENFWLGTKYCVGEENIFLTDCYKWWLSMYHSDKSIVIHPDESSWIDYNGREDLIIARVKVWKRLWWFFWWLVVIPYITVFHYKYYKKYFSIWSFFILSCKSLWNGK